MRMLEVEARDFVNKYPKKSIQFIDAMGISDWKINGFEPPSYVACYSKNGYYLKDIYHRWVLSCSATDKSKKAFDKIFGRLVKVFDSLCDDKVLQALCLHSKNVSK